MTDRAGALFSPGVRLRRQDLADGKSCNLRNDLTCNQANMLKEKPLMVGDEPPAAPGGSVC